MVHGADNRNFQGRSTPYFDTRCTPHFFRQEYTLFECPMKINVGGASHVHVLCARAFLTSLLVHVPMWRGGTRQTSPYPLCAECAAGCSLRTSSAGGSGRSAAGSAGSKKGEQSEKKRSHEHEHVDGVKDSLLERRCVCA